MSDAETGDLNDALDAVFGPSLHRDLEPKHRALASGVRFVRSQTHLARWKEGAKGRKMTAFECIEAFGWPLMARLAEEPVVLIARPGPSVAEVFADRRRSFGVPTGDLARRVGVGPEVLEKAESGLRKIPMWLLTRIAWALGFDYWTIGHEVPAEATESLAHRRREVTGAPQPPSTEIVLDLLEAASIHNAQLRLASWLAGIGGDVPPRRRAPHRPKHRRPRTQEEAWRQGADLARRTRELLALGTGPVCDLAELMEGRFGIPVVRMRSQPALAGATIRNGEDRGVLVNVLGINENPGTRRVTLAHELCHALWDADEDLEAIRIDWSDEIMGADRRPDPNEDRAQAFAGELLAPAAVVGKAFLDGGRTPEALHHVMRTFGVSLTCARIQIKLGSKGAVSDRVLRSIGPVELTDWIDAELPRVHDELPGLKMQRSGGLLGACLGSHEAGLIVPETMADLLGVTLPELERALDLRGSMPPTPR
ncbi:ImmA/IrrE family metallo-endopeptidase [Lichenibacterium dinghuense]|uniref:ImmA/IrrE family metallo-endopeptidase n=1 Tax=Lichenibacterium dinghuense TaxID=2895977 RepID=UPI001F2F61EB|nr:ImmA/IrrE family metallo-endopeptidase [Lichenibacterium sp. 6Y81]